VEAEDAGAVLAEVAAGLASRRERIVRELYELIEENAVAWRKAAFYSDPEVERIYSRLVAEWEARGAEGAPLDYASDEELEVLLAAARRYAFMPESRARAIAMARMGGEEERDSPLGVFSKLIERIRRK